MKKIGLISDSPGWMSHTKGITGKDINMKQIVHRNEDMLGFVIGLGEGMIMFKEKNSPDGFEIAAPFVLPIGGYFAGRALGRMGGAKRILEAEKRLAGVRPRYGKFQAALSNTLGGLHSKHDVKGNMKRYTRLYNALSKLQYNKRNMDPAKYKAAMKKLTNAFEKQSSASSTAWGKYNKETNNIYDRKNKLYRREARQERLGRGKVREEKWRTRRRGLIGGAIGMGTGAAAGDYVYDRAKARERRMNKARR